MADSEKPGRSPRQQASEAYDARTRLVLDQVEKENAASVVKTARLKALRLEKEAQDQAASLQAPEKPKPRKRARQIS